MHSWRLCIGFCCWQVGYLSGTIARSTFCEWELMFEATCITSTYVQIAPPFICLLHQHKGGRWQRMAALVISRFHQCIYMVVSVQLYLLTGGINLWYKSHTWLLPRVTSNASTPGLLFPDLPLFLLGPLTTGQDICHCPCIYVYILILGFFSVNLVFSFSYPPMN